MKFPLARTYLESFVNFETRPLAPNSFKLGRIQALLKDLGDPQRHLRCLHVAGSKGKGSTSVFAASILREAGFRVGLYTSPHLNNYRERIRVLEPRRRSGFMEDFEGQVSEKALSRSLADIFPTIKRFEKKAGQGGLSYFEVLTVLALYHFYRKQVDFVVLEVGLGGRLDATNSVDGWVCAITPISLEHTDYLGPTIEKIAAEKAGIIKKLFQRVVISPQTKEAAGVLNHRCHRLGISPVWIGKDIRFKRLRLDWRGQCFQLQTPFGEYPDLRTRMLGWHQLVNAATAVGLVESLRFFGISIPGTAVKKGIGHAFWPGRMELVRKKPFVVLDGAHTPASARALAQAVRELFPRRKITLIFGISQDKDRRGVVRELKKLKGRFIFTRADHPRAYSFSAQEAEELLGKGLFALTSSVKDAWRLAFKEVKKEEVILVTGSLFVVAEARTLCNK